MKRTWLFVVALFAAIVVLTGCAPTYNIDLSPDGHWVARTDAHGLWVRPTDSSKARLVFSAPNLQIPRFSPDNRHIVVYSPPYLNGNVNANAHVASPGSTWIADTQGSKAAKLDKPLVPPYAWSPNGRQLLGCSGPKTASVFDVGTQHVLTSFPVDDPSDAVWLSGGWAFAERNEIGVRRDGKTKRFPAPQLCSTLSADGRHVLWAEAIPNGPSADAQSFRIRSLDVAKNRISTLAVAKNLAGQFGANGVSIDRISLSPLGNAVCVTVLAIDGGKAVWDRFVRASNYATAHPKDSHALSVRNAASNRLEFRWVTAAAPLGASRFEVLRRVKNIERGGLEPCWSKDGRKLALAFDDGTRIYPIGHA